MYITGIANTIGDLFSLIKSTCSSNGYVVTNASATVSYFAKEGVFTRLDLISNYISIRNCLAVPEGGTVCPYSRTLPFVGTGLAYHIGLFEAPNLFVLNLQSANGSAVTMIFGKINNLGAGSPVGNTIAFASTTAATLLNTPSWVELTSINNPNGNLELIEGGDMFSPSRPAYIPFAHCYHYAGLGYGHGVQMVGTWDRGVGNYPALSIDLISLVQLVMTPLSWNNQAVLIPYDLTAFLVNSCAYAATIPHIYLIRLDNYNLNDIITIGADQYKVFTWGTRSASIAPNNNSTYQIGYCFKIN